MPQFQDDVMWSAFVEFHYKVEDTLEKMKEAFAVSHPGSIMRKFLAEQTVLYLNSWAYAWDDGAWKELSANEENGQDLLRAITACKLEGMKDWQSENCVGEDPTWVRGMVGEGPSLVSLGPNSVWTKTAKGWRST